MHCRTRASSRGRADGKPRGRETLEPRPARRDRAHRMQILIHSGDDYGKVIPVEGWSGPAAGNADSAHRSLMSRVEKMAAGMSIISKSIGQASDAILGVQHAITNAEELARKYGYQVAENGAV